MKQPPISEKIYNQNKIWLQNLRELILRHAHNNEFKTEDLGQELNISKRTLERKLKYLTGKSPKQYINELRLNRAHKLITEQNFGNVAQISNLVGFSKTSYFSNLFKQRFGYSPLTLITLVKSKKHTKTS
ncbi:MAG: helix-turn-helix transcriptional regulator [Chitinophagales bacterium]